MKFHECILNQNKKINLTEKQSDEAETGVLNITEEVKECQHQEEKMPNSLNNPGKPFTDENSNYEDLEVNINQISLLDLPSDQKAEATLRREYLKKKKKAQGTVDDTSGENSVDLTLCNN